MIIRRILSEDKKQLSILHKEIFSDHYLGLFPVEIIGKFYSEFIVNEHIVFGGCWYNDKLVGFVMGGWASDIDISLANFRKKNFFKNLFTIIFHPKTWVSTLKKVGGALKRKKDTSDSDQSSNYRLLSIGVDFKCQGKGIASQLINYFEANLPREVKQYGLSVKKKNGRAISFYKKSKFYIIKETPDAYYFEKKLVN